MYDNSIIITNSKNKIIRYLSNKGLYDVKYLTLKEFYKGYYFDYDKFTINYIMNHYKVDYELAEEYINYMYYIDINTNYNNKKIEYLKNIKIELDNNKLLIYDKLFKKLIKGRNIIVWGYDYIKKEERILLSNFDNITYIKNNNIYNNKYVYKCYNIEEECILVASKIRDLIDNNISIDKIKVMGIDNEYNSIITRIFNFYNLKIGIYDKKSIYDTKDGKEFLNTLELDSIKNKEIYNKVVDILGSYAKVDYKDYKNLLIYDFKHTYLDYDKYNNIIEVVDYENYIEEDDEYIFLMNLNEGCIPKIYKDEDYLNDKEKNILGITPTYILNNEEKTSAINLINRCKHITISYKTKSYNGDFFPSSIISDMELEILEEDIKYNYSNIFNKIKLTSYLDNYIKYNNKHKDLDILYNTYKDINYMSYDNKFTGIDKDSYINYINNSLKLSYSSMDNYYKCSFRYYIANILKLSIYEDTFMTYIGSLFHFILSICFNKDFDYEYEYNKYLEDNIREFNNKEKYYLNKLKEELLIIIDVIKKQYNYNSLDKFLYENKIDIDIGDNVIFTGIIDKMMYKEEDDNTLVAIIDYKTGNPDTNLNNIIHGLDMQLAVYLYLCFNYNKIVNPKVVGFYLQKNLSGPYKKDNKLSYNSLREKELKLEGYSNSDVNILEKFDNSYEDSKVIKSMKVTKNGFYAYSKIIDDDSINKVVEITKNKIEEAKSNILDAKFDINPKELNGKNKGCEFCRFKDICFMKNEDIVKLKEYKNLEFIYE